MREDKSKPAVPSHNDIDKLLFISWHQGALLPVLLTKYSLSGAVDNIFIINH